MFDSIIMNKGSRYKNIKHHGIVAGIFDSLKAEEVINRLLPENKGCIMSHGQAVKAMVLNILAYPESRPYIYPYFHVSLPTESLLGKGVNGEYFDDNSFLPTLNAIYEYGAAELFSKIVSESGVTDEFGTNQIYADRISFSLSKRIVDEDGIFRIINTSGEHTKRKISDSFLSIETAANQHGIPFAMIMNPDSEETDFPFDVINTLKQNSSPEKKFCFMPESVLYRKNSVKKLEEAGFFIVRPGIQIKESDKLLKSDVMMQPCGDGEHLFYETASSYGDVNHRWIMYLSGDKEKKDCNKAEKKLEFAKESFKELTEEKYNSYNDADKAINGWLKKNSAYFSCRYEITDKDGIIPGEEKPADNPPFRIEAALTEDEEAVKAEMQKSGRFILATNDPELSPDEVLNKFKNRTVSDRGFRFLIYKSFILPEEYLSDMKRAESIAAIMAVCMLIYSLTEFRLRKNLRDEGMTVPNQLGKQIDNPTLRWAFYLCKNIEEVTKESDGMRKKEFIFLNEKNATVIDALGPECIRYYLGEEVYVNRNKES